MKKRLLSALLALCMLLTMALTVAFAAEEDEPKPSEDYVAYIQQETDEKIYFNSLNEVIKTAQNNDTIVLLRDFEANLTAAWGINKNLTIF